MKVLFLLLSLLLLPNITQASPSCKRVLKAAIVDNPHIWYTRGVVARLEKARLYEGPPAIAQQQMIGIVQSIATTNAVPLSFDEAVELGFTIATTNEPVHEILRKYRREIPSELPQTLRYGPPYDFARIRSADHVTEDRPSRIYEIDQNGNIVHRDGRGRYIHPVLRHGNDYELHQHWKRNNW